MHRYETLIVLTSGLPEAQVRETTDRARRLIESMGGQIEEVDDWGTRDLAYLIENHSQGNYILITYRAHSDAVVEFERTLKLADEVLRFISLRLPITAPARRGAARVAVAPAAPAAPAEETETLVGEEGN